MTEKWTMDRPSRPYNEIDYQRLRQKFSRGDIPEDRASALAAADFVWYCDNRVVPHLEDLLARIRGEETNG